LEGDRGEGTEFLPQPEGAPRSLGKETLGGNGPGKGKPQGVPRKKVNDSPRWTRGKNRALAAGKNPPAEEEVNGEQQKGELWKGGKGVPCGFRRTGVLRKGKGPKEACWKKRQRFTAPKEKKVVGGKRNRQSSGREKKKKPPSSDPEEE